MPPAASPLPGLLSDAPAGLPGSAARALLGDALAVSPGLFAVNVGLSLAAGVLESAALLLLPAFIGLLAGMGGAQAHLPQWLVAAGWRGVAGLYLLAATGAALAAGGQAVSAAVLVQRFGSALRRRLHAAVLAAAWGSPALARPADLVHAVTNEAGRSAQAVQMATGLARQLLLLPALAAGAFLLSPGLTLVAAGLAAVLAVPMLLLSRRAHGLATALAGTWRGLNAAVSDDFAALKLLKMLGPARRLPAFAARLAAMGRAQLRETRATAAVQAGQRIATAIAVAAGAGYGIAVLKLDGALMVALGLAMMRVAGAVTQALGAWRQLVAVLPVYEGLRARERDCAAVREPAPAAAAPRLNRALRLEAAGFSHAADGTAALRDITLELAAGSFTALAGPSGAGKSTLADIVMGLSAPDSGRMLIDGRPLDAAARVAWRGHVGYVPQDGFLFHDTVRANLLAAAPGAGAADIGRALDAACAGFVHALPQGLETPLGDRGTRLSGGERQRIMIARALLQAPDLLVLDEATSAQDAETERRLLRNLAALPGRPAILFITHRPAVVAAADATLWLEDGRLRVS